MFLFLGKIIILENRSCTGSDSFIDTGMSADDYWDQGYTGVVEWEMEDGNYWGLVLQGENAVHGFEAAVGRNCAESVV